MPPQHSARSLGPARIVLSGAAAVLVLLVVWVAVRAVGPAEASRQPVLTLPLPTSASSSPPAASPSPRPSVSSPLPTKKASRKTSPSPSRSLSRSPSPVKTTKKVAPVRNDLAATLSVPASWDQGYVAAVRVRNNGRTAQSFTVTVSNSGLSDVRLRGTWNAGGTQSGDRLTFTGGPVQPGASATFGFQISKDGRGGARPSGCSVVGGKCTMS